MILLSIAIVYVLIGGVVSTALILDKYFPHNWKEHSYSLLCGLLWPITISIGLHYNLQEKIRDSRRVRNMITYRFNVTLYKIGLISDKTRLTIKKKFRI